MKKSKRLWTIALILVMSVAMLLGNTGLTVLAENTGRRAAGNNLMANGTVVTEVELDHTFAVPTATEGYTVSVTAPNGQSANVVGDEVTADQKGIYLVEVYKSDAKLAYAYNVYCKESGDFALNISEEYKIPSYASKDTEITLPKAEFVDEDDNVVSDVNIVVEAVNSKSVKTVLQAGANGTYTYNCNEAGSLYFTYKVTKSGSNLYKSYTKEYEVKVQENFSDTTAPKLSVSGVPASAQINNKVTLPAASATDDTDTRVEVKITVTAPNGQKIYEADVDEDSGYAVSFDETKEVVFDNGDNRAFYPQYTGSYSIQYQAWDDNGNASSLFKYVLNVTDNNPASLINGDEIDNAIPSKWGFNVKKAMNQAVDSIITFPMPDFRHQDKDADITVSFTLSNDDISRMVYFENIYANGDSVSATSVDGYNEDKGNLTFTKDGFAFDLSKIEDAKPGTYTAVYRSRVNSRTRTKTVTFDLQDTYTDSYAPVVEDIETVKYLVLKEDNTFVVPTVEYSDGEDDKATLIYTINGVDMVDHQGKELKVVKNEDKYNLVDEDDEVILENISDKLTISYYASDKVGNVSETKEFEVRLASQSSVGELTESFDLETADRTLTNSTTIAMGGFELNDVEDTMLVGYEISVLNPDGNQAYVQESRIIEGNTIYVRNVSFDSDKEGDYTIFIRVFNNSGESNLYVFNRTVTGKVTSGSTAATPASVVFETKENNNINEVYSLPYTELDEGFLQVVTIKGRKHSVIGDTFTPNSTGTFKIWNNTLDADKFAGKTFREEDLKEGGLKYYVGGGVEDSATPEINMGSIVPHTAVAVRGDQGFNPESYIFTINNDDVVWYKDSVSDANKYTGQGAWFVLPEVTAYTPNGPAGTITVTISYSSSTMTSTSIPNDNTDQGDIRRVYWNKVDAYYTLNEYEATQGENKGNFVFANRWAFLATENSVYNISYEAESTESAPSATASQRLVVGDVVAPTINTALANESGKGFTVENDKGDRITSGYKSGNKFFFDFVKGNIAKDNPDDSDSDISVKFELYNNSEVVYGSTSFNNNSEWVTLSNLESRLSRDRQSGYELNTGSYTVRITVKDSNGNESFKTYEFTVSATQSSMSVPVTVLTVVLTVLAALLIIFVIVYIVRLRKIKK